MVSSETFTTASLGMTRKETDLAIAGVTMLWNARRFDRVDENGDPYLVHRDLLELLEKLKGFSKSAFARS